MVMCAYCLDETFCKLLLYFESWLKYNGMCAYCLDGTFCKLFLYFESWLKDNCTLKSKKI